MHRPLELVKLAAERLEREGIGNARLEAELLMAHVLGIRRLDVYLQFERSLTPAEVDGYRDALRRRLHREPLQYITGEAGFREITVRVDRRVLIPRPETEVLVGEVLAWAASVDAARLEGDSTGAATGTFSALDVGTGSGAIALSLAHEGPFTVVATDASRDALELAASNAERLGLLDRIHFRAGPLWAPVAEGETFDVVVSNPPYVAEAERSGLMPEVRDWEPEEALFAGEDGLAVIRAIVEGAADRLRPGGLLALEVGMGQADAVAGLVDARRAYGAPRVVSDLAGHDRVVLAETGA